MIKKDGSPEEEMAYWQERLSYAQSTQNAQLLFEAIDSLGLDPEEFDEVTQGLVEQGRVEYQASFDYQDILIEELQLRPIDSPGNLEKSIGSSPPPAETEKLEQTISGSPIEDIQDPDYTSPIERDPISQGLTDPRWIEERDVKRREEAQDPKQRQIPKTRTQAYATNINLKDPNAPPTHYRHSSPEIYFTLCLADKYVPLSERERRVFKIGQAIVTAKPIANSGFERKAGFLADCVVNGLEPAYHSDNKTRLKREALETWGFYKTRKLSHEPAFQIEALFRQAYREAEKQVSVRLG